MRLTTLILITAILQVGASGYAQKITLSEKNAPLVKIFDQVSQQTGFDFLVSTAMLKSAKPVTITVKDMDMTEVLQKIFERQSLKFAIENKSVVVSNKESSFFDKVTAVFTNSTVRGIIIDSDNKPLSGATILVKDTRQHSTTNAKGEFSISNVQEKAILQISFIGYQTREITANSDYQVIKLELSTSKLDEVQVMAYGTTSRRLSTGNITTVTAEELEKQPVMNPLMALAGRVPGLLVTPTSRYASGTVKMEVRGRNTINPRFVSDPLYIIDGVPLTTLELGNSNYESGSGGILQNSLFSPTGGQSPFFNINTSDIQSIEVLKDADATAIYGSRGANGVILITTKKGKTGAATTSINISQGISRITNSIEMLSTEEYLQARREAFKNDGIAITPFSAPDVMVWDNDRYTDWQKTLQGRTGQMTIASAAIAGGDQSNQFRVSTNYQRQTEVHTASGSNQKVGLAVNLTHYSENRKFKMDLSANYSYSNVNTIFMPLLLTMAPNAPPIYNSNGELNYKEWIDAGLLFQYPFSALKQTYLSKTTFLTSRANLQYELFRGMELSSSFGYNNSHNEVSNTYPIASQNPLFKPRGEAERGTNDNNNWIIEPQLNYKTMISRGSLQVILGGTIQKNNTKADKIKGSGYTNDDLLGSIQLAPITNYTDNFGIFRYAAVFGRISYNWNNRYLLNINGRRDGSSRFGPGKQFGNFGSIGASWIASGEPWLKQVLPEFISFFKFRASYGITGSDAVGDYQYMMEWSAQNPITLAKLYSYGGISPLVSQHAVNPNYQWQENKKLEAGLHVSLFNDRINLEMAYYRNRCNNQLLQYPIPAFTGFTKVTANWQANVQNSGWEVSINANIIQSKRFSWTMSVNGSANKNILLDYPEIERSPYAAQYKIGESINTVYVLKYTGISPLTGQ